jgi:hypothetical protein
VVPLYHKFKDLPGNGEPEVSPERSCPRYRQQGGAGFSGMNQNLVEDRPFDAEESLPYRLLVEAVTD